MSTAETERVVQWVSTAERGGAESESLCVTTTWQISHEASV